MNLERILELYESLEAFLRKYGDDSILQSYRIVKRTIDFLKSKENRNEKEKQAIYSYKALFPGRGALSEFYVWDNDSETRNSINKLFECIHKELWIVIKEYI